MTLHPSFTRPQKPGYATLYTAHTTEFDPQKINNRLTLKDTNIVFAFETVITAWQYDFDQQKIDAQTQREVLRIPIKTQDGAIQQLTFDPYQKSWNADYGQLYFSLKYINELKEHPLYSGVVLRISPLMFGARNYTVPETNPFVKEPQINNEIVVMGGQNVEHFFWAKNEHTSIFIQHNNSEQHRLSKAKVGEDLLTQSQSNVLWQQPTTMSSMLLYQGRNFLSLRNKMVFFTLLDNQWSLTSLALASVSNESPTFEKLIFTDALSTSSHLNIQQDNQAEIILFDNHKSRLYSLQSTNSKVAEDSVSESNTTTLKTNSFVLYISLLAVLLLFLVFINRKKAVHKLATHALDKSYVRFEYESITQTILLFRADKKKVHKTLALDNITRCEVCLNNNVIKIIDEQLQNVISNQNEAEIREFFTKLRNDKMLDEQTRRIEIVLSDKDHSYTVCLYLRKGSNRVTGITYHEVIDILIDLCWIISKRINPLVTEERLIHKVAFSRGYVSIPDRRTAIRQPKKQDDNQSISEPASPKTTTPKPTDQTIQQTQVVDALDKLVNLHQQGYLTDEEFSLAKAKLLQ
jgi:hypothetical protein